MEPPPPPPPPQPQRRCWPKIPSLQTPRQPEPQPQSQPQSRCWPKSTASPQVPQPQPQPGCWPKIMPSLQTPPPQTTEPQPKQRCWPKMPFVQTPPPPQPEPQTQPGSSAKTTAQLCDNMCSTLSNKMPQIPKEWWDTICSPQGSCVAIASLISIVFICLVATIIWLSVLPKYVKYSIEKGYISGYSFKNNTLNATFHFLLQADNPNSGFAIYYKAVNVSVWYERTVLCDNCTVPSFSQPSRNITHAGLVLVAKDVQINGTAGGHLSAEWESGDVALDLKLRSKMMMKFGGFKIHRGLTVVCKSLNVSFNSSNRLQKLVACHKHVMD